MTSWGAVYRRLTEAGTYRLAGFGGGRWAHRCRPTHIPLLLTRRCNARCVHCDVWKRETHDTELSTADWKTVLTDLHRWLGPVRVGLTGGEPLLRADCPELVAHGSRRGLFVDLFTSGYGADPEMVRALALARPGRITVGLDGLGGTHAAVRGLPDFFDQADTTIRGLAKCRRAHGVEFEMQIRTVVMAHNLAELPAVADYAAEVGARVLYLPVEQNYDTPYNPSWRDTSPNWPGDPDAVHDAVAAVRRAKAAGAPVVNGDEELHALEQRLTIRQPTPTQPPAGHARLDCTCIANLQIEPNGDVLPCWRMPPIGNVRGGGIHSIWKRRPHRWASGCCLNTPDQGAP